MYTSGLIKMYILFFVIPDLCCSTFDEIRDLFLQGHDMVLSVTSEVKFFEVNLDKYCPAVLSTQYFDIWHYTSGI